MACDVSPNFFSDQSTGKLEPYKKKTCSLSRRYEKATDKENVRIISQEARKILSELDCFSDCPEKVLLSDMLREIVFSADPIPSENLSTQHSVEIPQQEILRSVVQWKKDHWQHILEQAKSSFTTISGGIPDVNGVKYFVNGRTGENSIFFSGTSISQGRVKRAKLVAEQVLFGLPVNLVRFAPVDKDGTNQVEFEEIMRQEFHWFEKLYERGVNPETLNKIIKIPHVSGSGVEKVRYFAEKCDGTLRSLLLAETGNKEVRFLECLNDALAAVEELHNAGIVHQDLKPENILFLRDKSGKCHGRLTDLGEAAEAHASLEFLSVGTLGYAPTVDELGEYAEIPLARDMFSVGMMILELIQQSIGVDFQEDFRRKNFFSTIDPGSFAHAREKLEEAIKGSKGDSLAKLALDLTGDVLNRPSCAEARQRLSAIIEAMQQLPGHQ